MCNMSKFRYFRYIVGEFSRCSYVGDILHTPISCGFNVLNRMPC